MHPWIFYDVSKTSNCIYRHFMSINEMRTMYIIATHITMLFQFVQRWNRYSIQLHLLRVKNNYEPMKAVWASLFLNISGIKIISGFNGLAMHKSIKCDIRRILCCGAAVHAMVIRIICLAYYMCRHDYTVMQKPLSFNSHILNCILPFAICRVIPHERPELRGFYILFCCEPDQGVEQMVGILVI